MAHGSPIPAEVPISQGGQAPDTTLPEGIEGSPVIVNGQIIGWNIGGEFFTQEEVDALIATGAFPEEPSAPGPAGRVQFESERALQEAQAREAAARAKLAELQAAGNVPISPFQQKQLELELLRAENDVKELLFSQIGATTRTIFQAQEAERGRQQEIAGADIARFTATLRGGGVQGQTPADVFKQQGAAFVNQQIPQFNVTDSVSQLQAGLQGLQKLAIGGAPQGIGLAHGGVIEMENRGGAFTMRPQRTARLVGENPDGTLNPTTEIMITDPQRSRVEIIPLSPGAAHGVTLGSSTTQSPFAPGTFNFSDLDLGGITDLTARLRRSVGITRPFEHPANFLPRNVLSLDEATALGARQRPLGSFVRRRDSPTVFMVTSEGLRNVGTPSIFEGLGGRFEDVEFLGPGPFSRLEEGIGRGPTFTTESAQGFQPPDQGLGALGAPLTVRRGLLELAAVNPDFSTQDAIRLSNEIGFLPAPDEIASDFRFLDPAEQAGLKFIYSLAGFPSASFDAALARATPTGRFGGGQRIGFTGTRL